jgi:hypothetical protein
MLVTLIILAAIPTLVLYWILKKMIGSIKARTTIGLIVGINIVFWLCFFNGAALSFMYEPSSYWHSINVSAPLAHWDHTFPSGTSMLKYTLTPYEFVFICTWMALIILFTHCTIAFVASFSIGGYIVSCWIYSINICRKMRNPDWGFDESGELSKYRRTVRSANEDIDLSEHRRVLGIKA